ncbi:hypothetical protein NEMBOFW57_001258 [Staphylotrichum longicolle]|uniref:Uncharacterized protein n=1 Tax=Staphylotrichum longicolle TaxID=669026 RepID=A0AAD4F1B2_9PEZI|nr:hypothetical protein NEMBOFW57_001258 [Staphylotrichum longicolle]
MVDPPPLLAIPVEIQLAICRQLVKCHSESPDPDSLAYPTWQDALENFGALGSLSQTCKSLQSVVNPLLYECLNVSIYHPRSFMRLIEHFSQFGNRAALVKELNIGTSKVPEADMLIECAISAATVNFLLREANRLGLQLPPGGIDLSDSLESLLIDVILCQVPTVQKLVLSLSWTMSAERLASLNCGLFIFAGDPASDFMALRYATRLPKTFTLTSLRRLEARPSKGQRQTILSKIHRESLTALLYHAPALTHLQIGQYEEQQPGGILQDFLPELKSIHLDEASDLDLAAIARFCPKLEKCRIGPELSRDLSYNDWAIGSVTPQMMFSPGTPPPSIMNCLMKLLLPSRATLRELNVEWDKAGFLTAQQLAPHLSRFTNLQSLRLVLWQWPKGGNASAMMIDSLPASIESLCLGGRGIPVCDIAVLLCQRFGEGRFPGLKRFRYRPRIREERTLGLEEKVVETFKGTGVDCAEEIPDLQDI